ncbi:hypothetical protein ACC735_39895, partial [Rhizobium ruizarguesonis]
QFLVRCINDVERGRAASFLIKEPETVRWLKAEMVPATVFWDVGANVGLFSRMLVSVSRKPACSSRFVAAEIYDGSF